MYRTVIPAKPSGLGASTYDAPSLWGFIRSQQSTVSPVGLAENNQAAAVTEKYLVSTYGRG